MGVRDAFRKHQTRKLKYLMTRFLIFLAGMALAGAVVDLAGYLMTRPRRFDLQETICMPYSVYAVQGVPALYRDDTLSVNVLYPVKLPDALPAYIRISGKEDSLRRMMQEVADRSTCRIRNDGQTVSVLARSGIVQLKEGALEYIGFQPGMKLFPIRQVEWAVP